MRSLIPAAIAALALGVTACDSPAENEAEKQADAVEAAGEAQADALEKQANQVTGDASAALDAKADAVEQAADAKAEAIEDKAAGK
jgi:hypothetical protein